MTFALDPDVRASAVWLQDNVPASKLVGVAKGLATLAPSLWGHHPAEDVRAVTMVADPIVDREPRRQPSASE